jgi:hypothetical protein
VSSTGCVHPNAWWASSDHDAQALSLLVKIVACYWLGFQLIAVLIAAPYLSTPRFDPIFNGDGGNDSTWYTFFNVWSAYSYECVAFPCIRV